MTTAKRRTGFIVGIVLGLGAAALGVWIYNTWIRPGPLEEIAERLPADTLVLVSVRGIDDLYREYQYEIAEISEDLNHKQQLEALTESLGLDPLSTDDLLETGLAFDRTWGAAILGDVESLDFSSVFLIPVDDESALSRYLDRRLEAHESEVRTEEVEGVDTVIVNEQLAYAFQDDFLIICAPLSLEDDHADEETGRAQEATDCISERLTQSTEDSLHQDPLFESAMKQADPDWNILLYSPTEWWPEIATKQADISAPVQEHLAELVERAPAVVSTVALDQEQVRIQLRALTQSEYGHLFSIDGEDELADRIPGKAVALLRTSMHLHAAWSVLSEWTYLQDLHSSNIQMLEDTWGIDLEQDLIAHLSGHVTLLLLEPGESSDSEAGASRDAEWVVYAQIEDEDVVLESIETLIDTLRENDRDLEVESRTSKDGQYFILETETQTCVGIDEKHLILAVGPERCETVIDGIADGGDSFLDDLPRAAEIGIEQGPSTYAFIHTDTLIYGLSLQDTPGMKLILSFAEDLEVLGWADEESSVFELIAHPRGENLSHGIGQLWQILLEEVP
jgi:hypothetical protein